MGNFRIEINAVGGHGHHRAVKDGETLPGYCAEGPNYCPDCEALEVVEKMRRTGLFSHPGTSATITHWPGTPDEVVDDLLTRKRRGSFS